jgi:ATP-binding cassette, subfamily B, bacterial MsbA
LGLLGAREFKGIIKLLVVAKGLKEGAYFRLLKYAIPYWKPFVVSALGFVMYAAMQPLFAMTIDYVVGALNSTTRESVTFLPVFFIGLFFVRGVGSFVGNYYLALVSGGVVHQLRMDIFNKYTCLPVKYFDANNSGQLMSTITHNVNEVTTATTDSVKTVIREGLTAFCLLCYLVYVNWLLSLAFLVVAPFLVLLVKYVSKRMKVLSKRMQGSVGNMSHITSELVHGQRSVRSFGGEAYERKRFEGASDYNRRQFVKFTITHAINSPLTQFILSIALAILMYLALGVMEHAETGTIIGYLTAAFLLPKPIRSLSDANVGIQRGIAAAETLFEVLDEPEEINDGKVRVVKSKGAIEFKNVTFEYSGANQPALVNLSFKISAGQTVAIVGASGAGKTTLINLILRFYDCKQGEILLDGVVINDYNLADYRRQITLVEQMTTLFNDTVSNNIAYGIENSQQDIERIKQVAKGAYIDDFIDGLPNKYEEEIGEQGVIFSGGQRQRVALARAMYKDAPILVLDEATSALDTKSEMYIQKALEEMQKGRTTVVIAHRLSTIQNADVIVVMDKGKIIEQGSHKELLKKGQAYKQLHALQFGDEDKSISTPE